MPNEDTEIGHRQDFNEYKLLQEEYLSNLGIIDKKEQTYPPEKLGNHNNRQMSQIFREMKTYRMFKLKRGMQRVRKKT